MEHYASTVLGVSKDLYGGRRANLAGIGQGNMVSVNTCRCSSCIILRETQKENLDILYNHPQQIQCSNQQCPLLMIMILYQIKKKGSNKDDEHIEQTYETT